VEVWFQDELRAGQQGTLTRKWAYVFASICPATGESEGESVALIAPTANTFLMNAHLHHLSEELGPDLHAVLILDGAGWHKSKALVVPDHVMQPYSPELNPLERVWYWLRDRKLSNRILPADAELDALLGEAITAITPERFRSLCHVDWMQTPHDCEWGSV